MSDIAARKQPGKWRLRWAITKKEIRNISQHKNYLMIMFVPIFMSLVVAIWLPALQGSEKLVVVIYDAGDSALVESLQSLPEMTVQTAGSEADLLSQLTKDVTGGVLIPVDFDAAVAAGAEPQLTAYINTEASNRHISDFKRLLIEQAWTLPSGTAPVNITWQEQHEDTTPFSQASIQSYFYLLLVLLGLVTTSILLGTHLIIEEREKGTLPSLFASPIEAKDLLIGKGVAAIFFTLLLALILTIMDQGWVGNVAVTAVAIVLATLFLVCLALLLGLWGQTTQQCNTYGGFISIILIIPTWFVLVSLESIGTVPAFLVQLIPTYYFAKTLVYSLSGSATLETAGVNLLILTAFTIVTFFLLLWQLRQRPMHTI